MALPSDRDCGHIHEGAGLRYRQTPWLRLKRLLLGSPLSTSVQLQHRLPVFLGIPVFGADPLSSVAYATEEILIVLAAAYLFAGGPPALRLQLPITLAIAALMLIVATSYRRAILMYPMSGGSYTVARRNLGATYGLVAGAALIIDYILTVAVSVSAGVAALTSYVQQLYPYRVELSVAVILFIAFINLRGVRESGWWFALPVYSFVAMMVLLIGSSLYHIATGSVQPLAPPADALTPLHGLSLFVILRAFAHGCVGLTGTESVSNGVSAFVPPEAANATRALLFERSGLVTMFIGIGIAASAYHVLPSPSVTVLTQLAHANFGPGLLTALVAYTTLAILTVAANTAFAGFPRLLAYMARDGFAPRQLASVGDRLVYSRGIIALTGLALLLVVLFQASVNSLIPLYTVGVFLCFTLSQLGMLRKMLRSRPAAWRATAVLNIIGALLTGIVTVVVVVTKFIQGAWVVVLLIPAIVIVCRLIKRHYQWFERQMALPQTADALLHRSPQPLNVVVLVSGEINPGTLQAIACARDLIGSDPRSQLRALHIEFDAERSDRLRTRWQQLVEQPLNGRLKLEIVHSPFRWLAEPVLEYLDRLQQELPELRCVVIIPEFETGSWFTRLLHNASGRRLREILLARPDINVISSRFFLNQGLPRL